MKIRINFNTTRTIKTLAEKKAKKEKISLTDYIEDLMIRDLMEGKEWVKD